MSDRACCAEVWAAPVLTLLTSPVDVPRLSAWARVAGVSLSALRQRCYCAGISPKRSLRFARVFRGVLSAQGQPWDVGEWLSAGDPRTLEHLLGDAGLPWRADKTLEVDDFLKRQTLVTWDTAGVHALCRRMRLSRPGPTEPPTERSHAALRPGRGLREPGLAPDEK